MTSRAEVRLAPGGKNFQVIEAVKGTVHFQLQTLSEAISSEPTPCKADEEFIAQSLLGSFLSPF